MIGKTRRDGRATWRLGLSPCRPRFNTLALSPRELLRFVLHTPNVSRRLARCSRCDAEVLLLTGEESSFCIQCEPEGECRLLDADWWRCAANRMREACRRDPKLAPALMAEWRAFCEDAPPPHFDAPFSWLNDMWRTVKPRGRPFDALSHFRLAHFVDRLQSAGVSINQIWRIIREPEKARRQSALRAAPGSRSWIPGDFQRPR